MKPDIKELSLVFVGEINPQIIQPFWLVNKGLITESEGESATVHLIHNEISKFDLDWCTIEVNRKRLQIRSSQEPFFEVIKDLGISIFNILRDTPLYNLGINHIFHYRLSKNKYFKVGEKLGTFKNWNNIIDNPLLQSIELVERPRADNNDGHYKIRIAPSERIATFGVSININDHFNVDENKKVGSEGIITLLTDNWSGSISNASSKTQKLWKNLKL